MTNKSNIKRRARDAEEEETAPLTRARVRRARDDGEGEPNCEDALPSSASEQDESECDGDLIVNDDVEEEIIEDEYEDYDEDDEAYAEFQKESAATNVNTITNAFKSVSFADASHNKTKSSKCAHHDDDDGEDEDNAAAHAVMVWRPDQSAEQQTDTLERVAGVAGEGGIQLEYSNKAYDCFFQLRTEYPCLSFDVIQDRTNCADYRARYPLSVMLVCGTQADAMSRNELVILHVSNMHRTKHDVMSDEDSEADSYIGDGGESDDEDEDDCENDASEDAGKAAGAAAAARRPLGAGEQEGDAAAAEINSGEPVVRHRVIAHYGTANRVRCAPWLSKTSNNANANNSSDGPQLVAVWSDAGHVQVFDLDHEVRALTNFSNWSKEQVRVSYSDPFSTNGENSSSSNRKGGSRNKQHHSSSTSSNISAGERNKTSSALRFCTPSSTHKTEGYGLDWSEVQRGVFASGDCDGSLYVWQPSSDGRWCHSASHTRPSHGKFDETQFGSIEEIQWSPTQAEVLIAARAGGVVQVYDTRDMRQHRLAWQADSSDINVCDWNRARQASHLLVTGADSGAVAVWDLRKIGSTTEPIQRLRWHHKSITSVEFSLHNESVLAVTADDGQCTLWDLSLERDPSEEQEVIGELFGRADLQGIPDQLMFQHQGLNHAKEAHWHVQIPGMVITTDYEGLHLFRPMNWRSLMK